MVSMIKFKSLWNCWHCCRIGSKNAGQVVVGFAAETETEPSRLENLARLKLEQKGCDILVANDVTAGKVFNEDTTSVLLLAKASPTVAVSGTKRQVANRLVDAIVLGAAQ